ncbi:penicillin-binding protein 2 [Vagococcus silagei]|uniref:Penicillin-binding protein 2 n=2 Tax=Vagococcus silagei TaxID=2508885 RepID=A0A4S3B677_9ENTE|nr:penicillin-binding protein 2 [Vagococcus silagei]
MFFKKIKNKINSKNQTPARNRRNVGLILSIMTIAVFVLFTSRFIYIVTIGKVGTENLNEKKDSLYQGSSIIKAKRGTIFDRNGLPIAKDATSYSLYAELSKDYIGLNNVELFVHEKDHNAIAEILNKHASVPKEMTLEQLKPKRNKAGKEISYVEFGSEGKNLSLETKTEIEKELQEKKITGIYFNEHPDRMYPNGEFASYLIGYASPQKDKNGNTVSISGEEGMGIEKAYDKVLKGEDGHKNYQRDSKGNEIPGTEIVEKKAKDGQDIYTTIDTNLQVRLEDAMSEVQKEAKPVNMTATLMNAKTGEILAASQRPTFDPQTKRGLYEEKGQPKPVWENLLIENPYEPGSTMKVFTMAAAIDSGNLNENETFQSGKIQVEDRVINDWNGGEGKGPMTYRQALAWSSNVGMIRLEQKMGPTWQSYLQKFGFGKTTDSNLPNEKPGNIQDTSPVDTAMTSFGQAINVTNFQMMQGFSAIANDGKMMKPQYLKKVTTEDKKDKVYGPKEVGQPVKSDTANKVLDFMQDVVNDKVYGTGTGIYNIDGLNVSAKTGTAQIFDRGLLLTGPTDYIYSVVQMAPTENPEYIMYVTMKQPKVGDAPEQIAKISNSVLEHAFKVDAGNTEHK